ncbi:MAG: mevalonate kinase [Bacteroidia bacterium]
MRNISESSRPKPLPPRGGCLPTAGRERNLDVEKGFSFNSKLLLFGEYGLMFDAMALSIPFPKFSGFLDFDPDHSHSQSTAEIRKFYEHLKSGDSHRKLHFSFDRESLKTDLNSRLFFNSNIPQQYGVGSSGALVAALFSRYMNEDSDTLLTPELLKADFALLESYFHGRSSGLDPLISFLNQPLLLDSAKTIRPVEFDLAQTGLSVALIDTKTTGPTAPLVEHFIDRLNVPEFKTEFEQQFIPANNGCIESLLQYNQTAFFQSLEKLIQFQIEHFRKMIPGDFHALISQALNEKVFIKLLGSGGGGFLLAFAESETVIENWSASRGIELLKVV